MRKGDTDHSKRYGTLRTDFDYALNVPLFGGESTMSTIGTAAFIIAAVVGASILIGIVTSALGIGSYWPPGERNWNYYVHWIGSQIFNLAILVAYVADPGEWVAPLEFLLPGVVLTGVGFGIAVAAGFNLGVEETLGLDGDLRTTGWYRYSRNPQYVGYIMACVGCALLANAPQVTILMVIYLGWWVALPFAEEPWLEERYGEEYEKYAGQIPRFVGTESISTLFEWRTSENEQ
ncbi:methyltransferase family protein [Halovivax gelatinilyticus]|uniref:methyltransferase family protein n=1 Tax=Halovivax gelatinilyticus TaxID=2961597 RepID=UPI0020CA58A8|nr:PEMT/PEM2 methyltransferase family protein [Halovivax gelatinilyticus]